jgi:hypothetical protein
MIKGNFFQIIYKNFLCGFWLPTPGLSDLTLLTSLQGWEGKPEESRLCGGGFLGEVLHRFCRVKAMSISELDMAMGGGLSAYGPRSPHLSSLGISSDSLAFLLFSVEGSAPVASTEEEEVGGSKLLVLEPFGLYLLKLDDEDT